MKRAAGVVLALCCAAAPLAAQSLEVHASAGAAVGLSRVGVLFPGGVQGRLGTRLVPAHFPLALQLDLGWLRLAGDSATLGLPGVHAVQWSAELSAVYAIPVSRAAFLRPYVLAGGGVHRRPPIDPLGLAFTSFGAHVGGGAELRVRRVRTFLEARYVNVLLSRRDVETLSLSVGVRHALR